MPAAGVEVAELLADVALAVVAGAELAVAAELEVAALRFVAAVEFAEAVVFPDPFEHPARTASNTADETK